MTLEIRHFNGRFVLFESAIPVLTPRGNIVCSRYPGLMEMVAEDVQRFGLNPASAVSTFSLLVYYLDFAARITPQELNQGLLTDLQNDLFWDISAEISRNTPTWPQVFTPFIHRMGLTPNTPLDSGVLRCQILLELENLSQRQLMTLIAFNANLHSVFLGLSVIKGECDLNSVAVGLCRLAQDRLAKQEVYFDGEKTVEVLKDDFRPPISYLEKCHLPKDREEDYCRTHCIGNGTQESTDSARASGRLFQDVCGMHRLLRKFGEFSAFPDEVS